MTNLSMFVAQEATAAQSFGEFLEAGGTVMWPIAACSVLVLAFTLERLLALTRGRVCPKSVDEAVESIAASRFEEAQLALESAKSPGARILRAGMRRRGFELRDVEGALEDQAQKEIDRLQRNIRPLSLIAGVAPLLGLLGTVLGIAEAFGRVAQAGMGKPEMLASGIEKALTTTIAGLCVAIPAMLLAAYLNGRLRKLMSRTDERLAPVVEHLALRPQEHSDAA